MRKLALPLLAACAVFAVSVPAASAAPLGKKLSQVSGALKGLQKAVGLMDDINKGQTGAINGVDTRVTTVVANLTSLNNKVDSVVTVATSALTALQKGLTDLAAAVQGPGVAGQLGAAGSKLPGKADGTNTATPDSLPGGTVYRQIVLANASYPPGGTVPVGTPIGARTWVKLAPPGTAAPLDNAYSCTSAGVARQIGITDGAVTCAASNISATNP
jgi:hypothetical protein